MTIREALSLDTSFEAGTFDVAVVGAGHAGCEAAHASAKLGLNTILFTLSLDSLANLPCNPSIGGTSKGQLVREIDALGGIMGIMADKCAVQMRMLNRSKGPAVYSPRAQEDRQMYSMEMRYYLENLPNLTLKQAHITELLTDEDGNAADEDGNGLLRTALPLLQDDAPDVGEHHVQRHEDAERQRVHRASRLEE